MNVLFHDDLPVELIGEILQYCALPVLAYVSRVNAFWHARARPHLDRALYRGIEFCVVRYAHETEMKWLGMHALGIVSRYGMRVSVLEMGVVRVFPAHSYETVVKRKNIKFDNGACCEQHLEGGYMGMLTLPARGGTITPWYRSVSGDALADMVRINARVQELNTRRLWESIIGIYAGKVIVVSWDTHMDTIFSMDNFTSVCDELRRAEAIAKRQGVKFDE